MTAQVDMLRKLSIVAVGTLFSSQVSQVFAVGAVASMWLCVQCRTMPYRFREDLGWRWRRGGGGGGSRAWALIRAN